MNKHKGVKDSGERIGRGTLGVHLDYDALRVVEVVHGKMSDWINVPYPPGVTPVSPEFPSFLKQSLADVYSYARRDSVWAVTPMSSLQVRFLSTPRVRPRQLSNLVYWTFRKEIPFDPVQTVFDYDVEGEGSVAGAAKRVDATAYTVSQTEVDAAVTMFEQAGVRLDGMLIPSFAIRNIFRTQSINQTGTVLGLYVGDDSSSLMFLRGHRVTSHRVFKTGMNVILDALRDRHQDWSTAKAFHMMRMVLESPGQDPAGKPEINPADAVLVRELIHGAFGRLVQQVDRSVSAYMVGRNDEEIRNIYVCGSIAGLPSLVKELGTRINMASHILNPFPTVHTDTNTGAILSPEEGGTLAVAFGAALSTAAGTPNVLHTYVKREQDARRDRARKLVTVLGAITLLVLVGLYGLVARINRGLRAELEGYEKQLVQFAPHPDRQMIHEMVSKAAKNSLRLKTMARRGVTLSALNTLSAQTPAEIKLDAIDMVSGDHNSTTKKPATKGGVLPVPPDIPLFRIHVDGMVFGPPAAHQSILASYILRLEDTEIFSNVSLVRTGEGLEGSDQVLLFGLDMTTEQSVPEPLVALPVSSGKGGWP